MTLWVQLIREENSSSSQKQNKESTGAPVISLSVKRELKDYLDFCLRNSETRKKGEEPGKSISFSPACPASHLALRRA